jgi:transposase
MDADREAIPDDVAALKEALAIERAKNLEVEAELAIARAKASEDGALIAQQKLQIAKLQRQIYGQRSERSSRLVDQLALTFEELQADATEDELAAERAIAKTTTVRGFTRKRAERQTFPDHLPRERVLIDPPTACQCCGGNRLRRLGEDVTRTLEVVPRQWKVIETVREKFSCRDCEKISQPPAPFHAVARGWAGPSLLAMIMFEKFGQHQPLNRQADRYALEGVPIALSTMADAVGSVCTALDPLLRLLEAHVMAADRLHADDTTVPVLAKGKTDTGRCWIYVRDDRPFCGAGPPAAMFYYSRDRKGEHPRAHLARYAGILQADAYDGYNELYLAGRHPGPIREAACWAHYLERGFIWCTRPHALICCGILALELRINPHRSERLQEREQICLGLPWPGPSGLDACVFPERLQRLALHLQVRRNVPPSRSYAGMAEIVADDGHVGTRLQQRHGAAMAQHVGCYPLACKRRTVLRRDRRRVLVEDVGNAVARQWLAVAIDEDVLLIAPFRHAAQPVQRISRLAPQRQQPLLLALAAQTHLPRWRKLKVVPSHVRRLAHAGAAVVEEQQKRVVAPAVRGSPVRPGNDRARILGFEIGCRSLPGLLRRDRQHPRVLHRAG